MNPPPELRVVSYPGLQSYPALWELQKSLWGQRYRGEIADTLLLLEHHPVVTLGRNAKREHLLLGETAFVDQGIEVVEVDRGGDVTYHGPGQLVAYWIFDLRSWRQDVHLYLRQIEKVVIQTLAHFDLVGERSEGATGVWVEREKIAAIGLHLSHWVSTHGFALNISTDLEPFSWIVPCGLHGRGVTSMQHHMATAPTRSAVEEVVVAETAELFGRRPVKCSAAQLAAEVRSSTNTVGGQYRHSSKGNEIISEC